MTIESQLVCPSDMLDSEHDFCWRTDKIIEYANTLSDGCRKIYFEHLDFLHHSRSGATGECPSIFMKYREYQSREINREVFRSGSFVDDSLFPRCRKTVFHLTYMTDNSSPNGNDCDETGYTIPYIERNIREDLVDSALENLSSINMASFLDWFITRLEMEYALDESLNYSDDLYSQIAVYRHTISDYEKESGMYNTSDKFSVVPIRFCLTESDYNALLEKLSNDGFIYKVEIPLWKQHFPDSSDLKTPLPSELSLKPITWKKQKNELCRLFKILVDNSKLGTDSIWKSLPNHFYVGTEKELFDSTDGAQNTGEINNKKIMKIIKLYDSIFKR